MTYTDGFLAQDYRAGKLRGHLLRPVAIFLQISSKGIGEGRARYFGTYDIKGVMGSTVLLVKRMGKDVDPPTGSV